MLQTHFSKEGMMNYMVMNYEEPWEINYQNNLFQYHKVPYFLQYELREINEVYSVYYRLIYRTTIQAVEGHLPFTLKRLMNMAASIIGVMETVEEYLLEQNGILWRTDCIFLEADTGKLQFCYCPVAGEDTGTIKEFLTEIIQLVDKKDEEAVLFILRFYDLITEPDCTLEVLQEFRKNQIEGKDQIEGMVQGFQKEQTENPAAGNHSLAEYNGDAQLEEKGGAGERIVRGMLILVAGINLILIFCLLLNILTYHYMRYLFISMGALIFFTIIYMHVTKEESPDEIMKEYFENREPEEWQKAENAFHHREKKDDNRKQKDTLNVTEKKIPDNTLQTGQWGETSVLSAVSMENKDKVIAEETQGHLYLESFEKGKYPPIYIGNKSVVLGCMAEGCNYILQDRGISRMHAKIMEKADGVYLLDLNSTNGTYLNGEIIKSGEDYKLEEGDMVAFAKSEFYVAVTSCDV